jgi:hypothetical protein
MPHQPRKQRRQPLAVHLIVVAKEFPKELTKHFVDHVDRYVLCGYGWLKCRIAGEPIDSPIYHIRAFLGDTKEWRKPWNEGHMFMFPRALLTRDSTVNGLSASVFGKNAIITEKLERGYRSSTW